MLKKFIIGTSGILFLFSCTLFAYRALEPKAATDTESSYLNAVSSSVYALEENPDAAVAAASETEEPVAAVETPAPSKNQEFSAGVHYVYFCRADNPDCTYINDYVFKPLTEELQVPALESFEYYDLAPLGDNYPAAKLKSQWGFESYPAFITLTVNEDGTQNISNILSWNKNDPLDSSDLKRWMIDNQIWTGVIEDQGELIEQPE